MRVIAWPSTGRTSRWPRLAVWPSRRWSPLHTTLDDTFCFPFTTCVRTAYMATTAGDWRTFSLMILAPGHVACKILRTAPNSYRPTDHVPLMMPHRRERWYETSHVCCRHVQVGDQKRRPVTRGSFRKLHGPLACHRPQHRPACGRGGMLCVSPSRHCRTFLHT